MCRVEIIANQSVEEDVTELLEDTVPGICYTLIPSIQGRGGNDRKLGTTTWPEMNFVLFSYVEKESVSLVRAVVAAVKKRFPDEGIKLFVLESTDSEK